MLWDKTACLGTFLVTWHASTGKLCKGKGDNNIDFSKTLLIVQLINIFTPEES